MGKVYSNHRARCPMILSFTRRNSCFRPSEHHMQSITLSSSDANGPICASRSHEVRTRSVPTSASVFIQFFAFSLACLVLNFCPSLLIFPRHVRGPHLTCSSGTEK